MQIYGTVRYLVWQGTSNYRRLTLQRLFPNVWQKKVFLSEGGSEMEYVRISYCLGSSDLIPYLNGLLADR